MKKLLILGVFIYLGATGLTYAALAFTQGSSSSGGLLSGLSPFQGEFIQSEIPEVEEGLRLAIDPNAPKTEECPLNGELYTQVEAESWRARRPLAVMVENSMDARPQSGLSSADVVYEAVSEGGITRFMPIFYCEAQRKDVLIAPVRSARQFFVDMASEYNRPLYAHVGGANGDDSDPRVRALENIASYGWNLTTSLNQFSIGFPTYVRNANRIPGKDVATEHTMESSSERLWAVAEKRGWTNTSPDQTIRGKVVPGTEWSKDFRTWKFRDELSSGERGSVAKIAYDFWSGYTDFAVEWTYNPETNAYARVMGKESHIDLNNNEQIEVKNVVVLQTREYSSVDIHKHNYLVTKGSGKAWIFRDGQVEQGTWSKKDREERTILTDARGREVEFTRGSIWISTVNLETEPSY
mgnify:CR=1 FL=1